MGGNPLETHYFRYGPCLKNQFRLVARHHRPRLFLVGEVASCEREGEISDTQTQDSHDQKYRWVEGGLGDNGEFYCYETCNTGKNKNDHVRPTYHQ